ncbi:MAG: ATP-binding cassette domain-containing protein [Candidatus Nanopelagicales bacterium]
MSSDSSAQPFIETRELSLVTREGPVYARVELSFGQDRLAAIVERSGTGRSALLLTLAGRMRGWTGMCRVAGLDAAAQHAALRQRTSIARLGELVRLEPRLTVAESITERFLIDGMPWAQEAGDRFDAACASLQVEFARQALVGELSALDQTRLALALAIVRPAEVVFLDDAYRQLDEEQCTQLGEGLSAIVAAGTLVVVTVLEASKLPVGTAVHRLTVPTRPVAETAVTG